MNVTLILVLIILLIIIGCCIYVKAKIENFSQKWFGTKDLLEGINKQKLEIEGTPKTPYGMDSLVLPEIAKDFPNLNINEMKKLAENSIFSAIKSIENKKLESFNNVNVSGNFLNKLQSRIDDLRTINMRISSIRIHKTVINKYDREESKCRLVFQTAIGYKVAKDGETIKKEERINTEFIYIYNYKNIKSHESISLKCPNCGAPIQELGIKVCPYCKSGIIDLATKTWQLNDMRQV